MDAARYREELRQRDRLIEQMAETIRRQEALISAQAQEIARLKQRVSDLEGVLERQAKAKQSKTPRFSGDDSLRTQERQRNRR